MLRTLLQDITALKGVGTKRRLFYAKLMGAQVVDALWHLPTQIEKRQAITSMNEAKPGQLATIVVEIISHHPSERSRRPYRIVCTDGQNMIHLVFFNPYVPFLKRIAIIGAQRTISGKVDRTKSHGHEIWEMVHPHHIGMPEDYNKWVGIEPIYGLTAGVTQKMVQEVIQDALSYVPDLPEWLDEKMVSERAWPSFNEALKQVHSPQSLTNLHPTSPPKLRLSYDEMLAHQLSLRLSRIAQRKQPGQSLKGTGELRNKILEALPFSLTSCQQKALADIAADMEQPHQMLRLLQGDVGSGKTLVALLSMVQAIESGYQTALLAPTEILARQHLKSISAQTEIAGITCAILTGREQGKTRKKILEDLAAGEIQILIGTHAIFQDPVIFHRLGLVVIDEQHRFGVEQRLALSQKGDSPDILSMTATPIPRTLMLANYGEMDSSILREKPPGRQPIVTKVLSLTRLPEVVSGLARALETKNRIYWVCPLVEESEASDLAAATERFEYLSKIFPDRVALIHGKMKGTEKDSAMAQFSEGSVDILVATTVIEVGVDVPEATIMVIEHAERFGLSQLHQLRGRIGRGNKDSTCLLMYGQDLSATSRKRLEIMRQSEDGFFIAEEDLKLRGGGEVLGIHQSGLPRFHLSDLAESDFTDLYGSLLSMANKEAKAICKEDPNLLSERGLKLKILLELFGQKRNAEYKRSG